MLTEIRRVCRRSGGGRDRARRRPRSHDRVQNARTARRLASIRASAYAWRALPPTGCAEGPRQELEGTRHMLRASALSLTLRRPGTHRRGVRRIRLRRRRATRRRWFRPARRSTWRRRSSPRASGARTRSRPPARSCAPTIPAAKLRGLIDKELAEEGDGLTWEKRLRVLARRGRRRLGDEPPGRGAELRGDRRDARTPRRRRRRWPKFEKTSESARTRALLRRASTTRSTTRAWPTGSSATSS